MIYLPDTITSSMCAYVYDSDTIRVYEEVPRLNATINYTDYFINSHYVTRSGSTSFGNWSTISYDCLNVNNLTTNAVYRNDFTQIMIMAFILIFMCWFMISKLYRRLFYGRKIF